MKFSNFIRYFGLDAEFDVNNVFIIFTYLLSTFPLLSFGIRSVVTIIWTFFGVLCFIKNKNDSIIQWDNNNKGIIIFLLFSFLILTFSLLYSEDVSRGIKKLTQMLSLMILPVIFYLNKSILTRERIHWIIKIFCFSVLVFVLYQVLLLVFNLEVLTDNLTITEIKRNNLHHLTTISNDQIQQVKIRRLRNFIAKMVDSHPIYQGLWMSLVIYFNYYKLKFCENSVSFKIIRILTICLMFFWMILISARMPLIATFIAGIITIVQFRHYKLKKIILLGVIFLGCFSALFVTLKPVQTRFKEIFENMFVLPTKGNDIYNYNSTNIRTGIYYCSAIVAKDNWLFGMGIGDVQENLSRCYDQKIGAKIYTWKEYNSHNQYMFFLLSAGVFSLITFSLFLILLAKKAFLIKRSISFYALLISSIVFSTENLLSRSDGILFFSLFVSLILSESVIDRNNEVLENL